MIPKIEIRFSFIYNKKFNPSFKLADFLKLKQESVSFVELVNKNIKKILYLIAKHNEPWKREHIPIYIVSGNLKSFSDPLTLRYRGDHKLLLLILIHELIHNNFNKKFKSSEALHKKIDEIYQKVINDLNLEGFEQAIEKYSNFH